MTEDVARAICNMAGRSSYDAAGGIPRAECGFCERQADGKLVCIYWQSFKSEAQAAIQAAYAWHKKERRWPGFVGK